MKKKMINIGLSAFIIGSYNQRNKIMEHKITFMPPQCAPPQCDPYNNNYKTLNEIADIHFQKFIKFFNNK